MFYSSKLPAVSWLFKPCHCERCLPDCHRLPCEQANSLLLSPLSFLLLYCSFPSTSLQAVAPLFASRRSVNLSSTPLPPTPSSSSFVTPEGFHSSSLSLSSLNCGSLAPIFFFFHSRQLEQLGNNHQTGWQAGRRAGGQEAGMMTGLLEDQVHAAPSLHKPMQDI